ncbi:MAG: epimerase [Verrucomicrobia bacterium 61-8]|nr:SDR family NAD(P)-dependent oxidoreductase [Verrucomicrobiota bacterium]OJV03266.1 MAG: epimerase [Verrucomicrobia bacterium 61-8]
MKVLVTGGAGFIGSHLVRRLLRAGHAAVIVDNFNDYYNPAIKRSNIAGLESNVELIEANIEDADRMKQVVVDGKFDAIVHIAARAGVRPSLENPLSYLQTNVNGTYNMLEAAKAGGVGKFLFASSSSVYGLAKTVPFSEDLPLPQTLSPYAATKLAGEHLCGNFSHLYDLGVVCLRFFTVYGPGQRPDLAIHKFTDLIYNDKPIPKYGDGGTRRDYTYIDDIIQGVMGALAYDKTKFEIVNLGESETTTLTELIEALEKSIGKKAIIQQLPEQQGDMPLTCADIRKARALLGYDPKVKISEGIPRFVEWYASQHGK